MKDLMVQEGVTIPLHEIEISASRAGGPGGQHVNKTNTRITVRWNLNASQSLTPEQKERITKRLESQLTQEGDLVIHNGSTRSQEQNKHAALEQLANRIRHGLSPLDRHPVEWGCSGLRLRFPQKQFHPGP